MKNFGEKEAWTYPVTSEIFWVPPIISGTGKATDFKLCCYIQRVHLNIGPLKILENRKRGLPSGLPEKNGTADFFGYPLLSQERVKKATDFIFCMHIYRLNRNKSPLKISGKVAVGVVRDS